MAALRHIALITLSLLACKAIAQPLSPGPPHDTLSYYSPQEQEVLSVIDRFFTCMTARDSAGMASILEPEGMITVVDADDPAKPVRTLSHAQYLARVKKGEGTLLERYWDPTVRLDSAVAVVSCPYDFHFNGAFSHCGLDVFTLARRNGQWRIAGTVFSMKKTGCVPSPLGPLKP